MKKYTVINDFKDGLDTRRGVLTSEPGSLVVLENAHINQGGEIEKREKFTADDTVFPALTFGLEYTNAGLITFYGGNTVPAPLPTGVTAVRLYHPAELYTTGTVWTLSAVPFSCNYGGNAFVAGQWTDGAGHYAQYLYYGAPAIPSAVVAPATSVLAIPLIEQSWEGIVLAGRAAVTTLATDLARAIVRETVSAQGTNLWRVIANDGTNGWDSVFSPVNVTFNPLTSQTSGVGLFVEQTDTMTTGENSETSGIAGAQAVAGVTVTAMTAGYITVIAPAKADGSASYTLAYQITFHTSIAQTVLDIVAAINLTKITTGYSAQVDVGDAMGKTFDVFAPIAFGSALNGSGTHSMELEVDWNDAGTTVISAAAPAALRVVSLADVLGSSYTPLLYTGYYVTAYANSGNFSVSGGTPPYTYAWTEVTPGLSGIQISNAAIAFPSFTIPLAPYAVATGVFNLKVTDAATNNITITVNVILWSLGSL